MNPCKYNQNRWCTKEDANCTGCMFKPKTPDYYGSEYDDETRDAVRRESNEFHW